MRHRTPLALPLKPPLNPGSEIGDSLQRFRGELEGVLSGGSLFVFLLPTWVSSARHPGSRPFGTLPLHDGMCCSSPRNALIATSFHRPAAQSALRWSGARTQARQATVLQRIHRFTSFIRQGPAALFPAAVPPAEASSPHRDEPSAEQPPVAALALPEQPELSGRAGCTHSRP